MTRSKVLIDLSQFVSQPVHTGIQRVLTELISRWPRESLDADIGFQEEGAYHLVAIERAAKIVRTHFRDRRSLTAEIQPLFIEAANDRIKSSELSSRYEAYFLPEPTFRSDVLDVLHEQSSIPGRAVFALLYDCLPQTAPQVFASPHQMGTSRYFRLIASLNNVACISQATLDCLELRLRRRPVPNSKVICLGSDSFRNKRGRQLPIVPTFVAVGTIEPRKNHQLILAAFDELWRGGSEYRLIFIGAPGWHSLSFLTELNARATTDPAHFIWHQHADDELVRASLAGATGAIFVSELEGYGLPAVEALAAGCPLVTTSSIPALDSLSSNGQIRLGEVTPATIAAAVRQLADPIVNRRMRKEVAGLSLATWHDFPVGLVGWMRATLDGKVGEINHHSGFSSSEATASIAR